MAQTVNLSSTKGLRLKMCAFKGHKVKSDKVLLKKDGVIAYKTVVRIGDGYCSSMRHVQWNNKRMTLEPHTSMYSKPTGRGPGIYAWKTNRDKSSYHTVVKVLLYGRVIEYAGRKNYYGIVRPGGYMAQRAEILEVL